MTSSKEKHDGVGTKQRKMYPTSPEAYELHEEIGLGVSAWVYRAVCLAFNEVVAIKIMDLDNTEISTLNEVVKEAQTMSQLDHPNMVTCHCSFLSGTKLWLVMPFLTGGSVHNIMRYAFPDGLDEAVIATIIKEVLKALDYFHRKGNIHRDIKAGNILLDAHGNVKLADFGVSACCWGSGGVWKPHGTFVGTPCWMAPEVMEQVKSYDYHADIWSLGITIIELAYGHAPFAKYPPMKVMMMTLQNPPQQLEDTPYRHFSRSLRDLVQCCLHKDPQQRPSASKLLEHRFLKEARKPEYLAKTLLEGLPPLGERSRILKERHGESAENFQQKERRSQANYTKGVSGWDFDVDALRKEADPASASQPQSPGGTKEGNGPNATDLHIGPPTSATAQDQQNFFQQQQARSPHKKNVQHKGRFEVYEDDEDESGFGGGSPPSTSEPSFPEGRQSKAPHVDATQQQESGKPASQPPQKGVSSFLLPQVKAALYQNTEQSELLRAVVSQLESMSQGESAESSSDLQQQVRRLAEENVTLKRRIAELEAELAK